MTFELFKWSLTVLSLIGVVLNIHHRRECFAVWLLSNLSWAAVDTYHGIWSQAALQLVYAGLSVWGLWKWRKHER